MRAGGVVSGDGRLRAEGNNYVAALLLVEPGRAASDGLKAPARHHDACVYVLVYVHYTTDHKVTMPTILAGASKSAEPRPLTFATYSTIWDTIASMHGCIPCALLMGKVIEDQADEVVC